MNISGTSVQRKIYFYRVDAGFDDAGRPVRFEPTSVLQHIESLSLSTGDRHWEGPDGNATCCWVEADMPLRRMKVGTVRRGDLPQMEQAGTVSPLPIPPGSGLVEQIHVVFFPEDPEIIIGAEFNHYGPRISRLKHYLDEKAKGVCPSLAFQSLLRGDVRDQLARLKDIRLFDLRVQAPFVETLRRADESMWRGLDAWFQAGGAEEVEVLLRKPRSGPKWLSQDLVSSALRIMGLPGAREGVSRFVIKGRDEATGQVEEVDVLSDKLISVKKIVRQGSQSRALDSASAYQAIEEAFSELRPELIQALGVRT